MPKAVEDCVKKIHGVNKRTGKPYTQSEKYAICNSANKKSKEAELSDADINSAIEDVTETMERLVTKLVSQKLVSTRDQGYAMAEVILAKADYDLNNLDFAMKHIR